MWKTLIESVQIIGSLVPVIGVVAMLHKKTNKVAIYLLLTNIGSLVMNGGYWLQMRSHTFREVMIAYKISYIGNVLFYLFFSMFVVSYFTKHYKRWIFYIWAGFEAIPLICLLNENWIRGMFNYHFIAQQPLFRYYYLTMNPGPLYRIRHSIIMIMILGVVSTTLWNLLHTKIHAERANIFRLLVSETVIVSSYFVSFFGDLNYDIVPICSSFAVLAIILSVLRDEFFGITEMGRDWSFEQMANAVVIVDSLYGFLDANLQAKKLFPELEKQKVRTIVSDELYWLFLSKDCDHEINGRFYEMKKVDIRKNGVLEGYCMSLEDITAHQNLMQELREEKIRADEANQAKSAFVSNMSHEIRTPMNAIVGMTEILMRKERPKDDMEYLGNIKRSGNALVALINDILDISKIESGKMEIVEAPYYPYATLLDLQLICQNRVGEKDIGLVYEVDSFIPAQLYGDVLRIRQILLNLMSNAIKFTEKGTITFGMKVTKLSKDRVRLDFSLKDTGQGIKEEDMKHLFEKFNRGDLKLNHTKEGTGLGLAICRQLVEMMGGKMTVTSEYGVGSEFAFYLEQKVMDWRDAREVDMELLPKEENALNFIAPEAKIMLVDDNEMNLKVALGLLAPLKMQIDTAMDGREALAMVQQKEYHLIFMDHMMPIMDGIEATEAIRALEGEYYKNVPIIALTANAFSEARQRFNDAGMNDFVAKPINLQDISEKLKTWLPEELQQEEDLSDVLLDAKKAEQIQLPKIEGLDVREGIANCGSLDLYLQLLGDFYRLIDMKAQKMEKCLEDGLIRDYTIEVHALKNTARMIGAIELCEWCLMLEHCGNNDEVKVLKSDTPGMLELYRSYKVVLEPYAKQNNKAKKQVPKQEMIAKLQELRDAMDDFDLDKADEAMKQIEEYFFDEECESLVDELRAYVADVAMEDVLQTAERLMGYLELQQEDTEDA